MKKVWLHTQDGCTQLLVNNSEFSPALRWDGGVGMMEICSFPNETIARQYCNANGIAVAGRVGESFDEPKEEPKPTEPDIAIRLDALEKRVTELADELEKIRPEGWRET